MGWQGYRILLDRGSHPRHPLDQEDLLVFGVL
jgi:hypothetical protein